MFITGTLNWHPFFQSAYGGGGFTLGAGYLAHVGSYNTLDLRGSYTFSGYKRIETEFIAPRLFDRRGPLSRPRRLARGHAGRLLRVGTGNTSATTGTNYSSGSRTCRATLEVRPTRRCLFLAGGAEFSSGTSVPGEGDRRRRSRRSTARDVPGLGAKVTYLHTQGTGGHRLAHEPRLRAARRLLRRHAPRLRGPRRRLQLPPGGLRGDPARPAPPRRLGAVAARTGRDHDADDDEQCRSSCCRPGRRLEPARLPEPALPRSAQPADAGRVAGAGEQLLRHRHLLRRRQGRGPQVGPRLRGPAHRLRHRFPPARAAGDPAAHRAREEQRRLQPRLFRQRQRSEECHHADIAT